MKTKRKKIHPKLLQLQKSVGGKIDTEDGELYYGPPGKEIFIHTPDGTKFVLWSQRPLYTLRLLAAQTQSVFVQRLLSFSSTFKDLVVTTSSQFARHDI